MEREIVNNIDCFAWASFSEENTAKCKAKNTFCGKNQERKHD